MCVCGHVYMRVGCLHMCCCACVCVNVCVRVHLHVMSVRVRLSIVCLIADGQNKEEAREFERSAVDQALLKYGMNNITRHDATRHNTKRHRANTT